MTIGAAAQGRDLLDVAPADLGEALGALEDALDLVALEAARSPAGASSLLLSAAPTRRLARRRDRDLVDAVDLLEADVDPLLARGRQVLADVVGADRKLAVAAVDEHRELDALRAPVVEEGLDRGAHGAAGEEDVVDEDDRAAGEVEVEVRGVDDRLRLGLAASEVVAVEGDVEVAERDLGAGQLADQRVQARGEDGAAGVDADQREPSPPGFFSTISCAIRTSVRRRSSRSSTTFSFSKRAPSWPLWTGLKEPTRRA